MSLLFLGFSINVYQTHVDLQAAADAAERTTQSLKTQIGLLETEKTDPEKTVAQISQHFVSQYIAT